MTSGSLNAVTRARGSVPTEAFCVTHALRTVSGAAGQQDTIILGPGRGDALTAIGGVDFEEAWQRREVRTVRDLHVPVLARAWISLRRCNQASGRGTARDSPYFRSAHSSPARSSPRPA